MEHAKRSKNDLITNDKTKREKLHSRMQAFAKSSHSILFACRFCKNYDTQFSTQTPKKPDLCPAVAERATLY